MSRLSLLIIFATIISGLLVGWTGALLLRHFFATSEETQVIAVNNAPLQHSPIAATNILDSPIEAIAESQDAPIPAEPEPTVQIVVEVTGAVRRPGVYTFKEGMRVKDGLREAGGVTQEANMADINIAAKLMDNTSLYIPQQMFHQQDDRSLVAKRSPTAAQINPPRYTRSGWTYGTPPGNSPIVQQNENAIASPNPVTPVVSNPSNGLININTASLDELQKLPGIGPKTAEKINAYRNTQPFQSIGDLEAVNGIGPKTMDAVRDMITVD